jgi:hypothetical protein
MITLVKSVVTEHAIIMDVPRRNAIYYNVSRGSGRRRVVVSATVLPATALIKQQSY